MVYKAGRVAGQAREAHRDKSLTHGVMVRTLVNAALKGLRDLSGPKKRN